MRVDTAVQPVLAVAAVTPLVELPPETVAEELVLSPVVVVGVLVVGVLVVDELVVVVTQGTLVPSPEVQNVFLDNFVICPGPIHAALQHIKDYIREFFESPAEVDGKMLIINLQQRLLQQVDFPAVPQAVQAVPVVYGALAPRTASVGLRKQKS